MNRAFVVCLLLQVVYAAGRNISITIDTRQESPAGVTYVEGKAPEELKAGPTKNSTKPEERITQAAFIRSSSRDIPKDDEIENEEFERFIKKHLNRPTIETVFVSSSPSPLYDEEFEEFNEESSSLRSQAEFFKSPAENQTFQRSVALPTAQSTIYPSLDHGYGHGHINLAGGIPYGGSDGIIVQADGGQYSTYTNGHYLPTYQDIYGGGVQQFYQVSDGIPSGIPSLVPRTINVPQHSLKTKTYEIRRPAIQKHYYDIEERVIIRPAGSIVVELNRPVAKVPTGETVVALGGLQGGFAGFQQSQGGIGIGQGGLQGGITGIGLQQSQGGFGFPQGVGIQQLQGGIGVSQGGLQGGIAGIGIQQSQGGSSSTPSIAIGGPQGGIVGPGFQQSQGAIGVSQGGTSGVGIQQSQGGVVSSTTPSIGIGGPQGGVVGTGFQQSQGAIGVSQGGLQGGSAGVGIQQSQGGVVSSTTPSIAIGGPQGGVVGTGFQQSQGAYGVSQGGLQDGSSGVGIQQSQGGVVSSSTPSIAIGGPQGGVVGTGFQQSQGAIGVSQGGPQGGSSGVGIQQSQGGVVSSTTPSFAIGGPQGGVIGTGFQQAQGAIGVSQGGLQGGISGVGIQQSQGGVISSTIPSITIGGPQGGVFGAGAPQGGFIGTGFQQSPGGTIYATTLTSYNPSATPTISTVFGSQGGTGIQQSPGGVSYISTFGTPTSSVGIGGAGIIGSGFQQSQGAIGVSQGGQQGGAAGVGIQQSQGGIISTTSGPPYLPPALPTPTVAIGGGFQQSQGGLSFSTTLAPPTSSVGVGGISGGGFQQFQGGLQGGIAGPQIGVSGTAFQQSQGAIGVSQGGLQGGSSGVGIQQSQGGVVSSTTPSIAIGGPQGGVVGTGFQQSQGAIGVSQGGLQGGSSGVGIQQSQGGLFSSTTPSFGIGGPQGGVAGTGFQQSQGAIGVSQGGIAGVGIQQSQGGVVSSTTSGPYIPPRPVFPGYPLPQPTVLPRPQQPYPSVSTTTASSISGGINNDDSVVVEASSNVRNRGTFQSTTTTERSFTSSVNRDASAYARGSSPGSVQAVSRNITPFMIAVGEPDFHYPPYVEITSNGSPLGNLQLVPSTSRTYPRMRYQGQLLTGEVRADDGQQQAPQSGYGALSQQNVYESPPNTPHDEQSIRNAQSAFTYSGSNQQPVQVSQISNSAHQQPAQVYRHNYIRTTSRPITISEFGHNQQYQDGRQHIAQVSQQPIQVARYRQPTQVYQISPQPVHDAQVQQQHPAQYRSSIPQRTNLVAQIRHQQQHSAQASQQQQDAQIRNGNPQQHYAEVTQVPLNAESHQRQKQDEQDHNSIPQQHVAEVAQQPIGVAEVRSSTHRHPNQYQHQIVSTTQQPEAFTTGRRLYQQNSIPSKYTQHHTINVAPSQHTIYFNNRSQQPESSGRSQNLETPPEPEAEDASVQSTNAEYSTAAAVISSTTSRPTEEASQQTYASVLANSQPGILYAPSSVLRHHPSHTQHPQRFSSEGSSLFSPSGRHLHLLYSQPPRAPYSQQTAPPSGQHISLSNERLQAQIPIMHQRQIKLTASSNSAVTNNPQQLESRVESEETTTRSEAISSTTPSTATSSGHHHGRRQQKYRNEQTRGALTLRSGRTYGDHRVIASTPAPSDGGAASESVQTRRIVVNHPFQTVQEVVEQEPITKYHQVTVNEPAPVYEDGLQQDQQKASYRQPAAAYKVAATHNHPGAAVSYRHSGSH